MSDDNLIAVELVGGPMDGFRDSVALPWLAAGMDVRLYEGSFGDEKMRCAYGWANRTIQGGRRWVMEFRCVVSRWKVEGRKAES